MFFFLISTAFSSGVYAISLRKGYMRDENTARGKSVRTLPGWIV